MIKATIFPSMKVRKISLRTHGYQRVMAHSQWAIVFAFAIFPFDVWRHSLWIAPQKSMLPICWRCRKCSLWMGPKCSRAAFWTLQHINVCCALWYYCVLIRLLVVSKTLRLSCFIRLFCIVRKKRKRLEVKIQRDLNRHLLFYRDPEALERCGSRGYWWKESGGVSKQARNNFHARYCAKSGMFAFSCV